MFCKITLKGELLCTLGSFSLRTSPSILPPVLTGFSRPCNTKAPWHDAHLGDYVSLHTATPGGTARVMRSTVFFLQSRRKKTVLVRPKWGEQVIICFLHKEQRISKALLVCVLRKLLELLLQLYCPSVHSVPETTWLGTQCT